MIVIDVFHDTVCPWCRIGKAHLKQALTHWNGAPVEIRYRTFFLNEGIPAGGHDFRAYMLAKGGGRMRLEDFFDAPRRMGAKAGITFNFEAITRAPNSTDSHRLIALTPADGKEAMIDALYAAYFEYGRDIGDLDVLVEIAAAQGMDADTVRAWLLGDEARAEVLAEAHMAQQNGISGVPFFIFGNRFALSGAQPPELMLRALQQTADFAGVG
jgi:predicted DsbA family dithiol-disulfide isomerase